MHRGVIEPQGHTYTHPKKNNKKTVSEIIKHRLSPFRNRMSKA